MKLIRLLLAATAFALVAMISMPARATCGTAKAFTTSTVVFGSTYTSIPLTIPAGQPGVGGTMSTGTYWCAVAGAENSSYVGSSFSLGASKVSGAYVWAAFGQSQSGEPDVGVSASCILKSNIPGWQSFSSGLTVSTAAGTENSGTVPGSIVTQQSGAECFLEGWGGVVSPANNTVGMGFGIDDCGLPGNLLFLNETDAPDSAATVDGQCVNAGNPFQTPSWPGAGSGAMPSPDEWYCGLSYINAEYGSPEALWGFTVSGNTSTYTCYGATACPTAGYYCFYLGHC